MSASIEVIQAALDRARSGEVEIFRIGGETRVQKAVQLDAERNPPPAAPVGELVDAALEIDSITRGGVRHLVDSIEFDTDPDYVPPSPDTPEFKTLTDGVPENYWPQLARASSPRQAEFIKQNILTELDATQKLQDAGWTGTALRIGVSVLDPVSLSTILLTGGSSLIMSGSRVARAVKLAAAGGAENLALEAALLGTRETKDVDDLYVALIGGVMAGGALGAILPAASRAKLYETGKDLTTGGNGPGKVANEVTVELDESLSVGAAQASRGKSDLSKETPSPEILNTPQLKGLEAKVRFDWYGQLAKSDNPFVRFLGRGLLEDPVGTRGVVQEASAEEFASVLKKRAQASFYRDANPALSDYLKGVPLRERGQATNRFFEAVTAAVRAEDFSDPVIGRAAQGMQRAIKTAADEAKRFGVKGFEDLDLTGGYVPRIPSPQKVDQLFTRFGDKQIEGLFAAAFSRATDIAEDVAKKIARGYLRNVRLRGAGAISDFHIKVADRDALVAMMKDASIADDEIEQVTKALKGFGEQDASKAGKIARAKRRLSLDESTVATLKDTAGNRVPVAITDLFENDARILTRMYANSVGGHAALARAGIRSPGDWEKAINNARLYADREGIDPLLREKEITKLQQVRDVLTGKPLLDYSDPVSALSFIARDWAYIAQSGAFGFAQASELAAVLTMGGFRLVSESVPALKGIFTRAANGELTDDLAREIEDFIAPGTDALLHSTVNRFEGAFDEALIPRANTLLEKTEGARHVLRKAAGYASGLTPITVAMQRLGSRYVAQRIVNSAFRRGRGFSEDRLTAMGLDSALRDRVFAQVKEHVADQVTAGGRNIPRLDLAKWTDLDARDAFVLAVNREAQRSVLTPTLGGTINVFGYSPANSEIAKVVTQFMTFALQAHSRILLHGVKHMDGERAVSWMFGMSLAGMAYVARMHLDAAGRKDRKKFLRERLAPDKIAAAAFNMSGFSALLPMAHDTLATVAPGMEPLFSHARTSGLGTSLLDPGSYPAGAAVKGVLNAASSAKDGTLTAPEYRNMQRLLPFARVIGIRQALDAMGSDLPEKARP